ncbi:MAG: redoxin domain-containing protein [Gaiella sp.]
MRLLRDRSGDLARAGVRVLGISLDSPWSHRAWAEALGLAELPLLSDALGEAAAACGVLADSQDVPKADRSAFLVRDGTVVGAWHLGAEMPDIDAIIAVARG